MGTVKRQDAERKRKKANVANLLMWFAALIFVLVYFGGYLASYLSRGEISTARVEWGYVSETYQLAGVCVRDEIVYRAGTAGVVAPAVPEGERVAAGGIICAVADASALAKAEAELHKVDEAIIESQTRSGSVFDKEIAAVDEQIRRAAESRAAEITMGRADALGRLTEKVEDLMDARRYMLREGASGGPKNLARARRDMEAGIALMSERITADSGSGIVSYYIDGAEDALSVAGASGISPGQMFPPPQKAENVYAGEPACRVVQSNRWLIAAFSGDLAVSRYVAEGNQMEIFVQKPGEMSYEPLNVSVVGAYERDGGLFCLFAVDYALGEYLSDRNVTVTIEVNRAEGLKIPNSAIAEKTLISVPAGFVHETGGKQYVTKLVNGKRRQTVISVTGESGDGAELLVIQGNADIRFGDVLINPAGETQRLEKISSIEGVYVANSGAPFFRPVTRLSAYGGQNGYTVLEPAANPMIKQYDTIVLDAKRLDGERLTY